MHNEPAVMITLFGRAHGQPRLATMITRIRGVDEALFVVRQMFPCCFMGKVGIAKRDGVEEDSKR